jgi:hypothetical protein
LKNFEGTQLLIHVIVSNYWFIRLLKSLTL